MSRTPSRAVAALTVSLLACLLFASPASAEVLAVYHAKAQATGLDLEVFGQGVTLGLAQASVTDQPAATGRGVGVLLPGDTFVTEEKQEALDPEGGGTTSESCGPISLPPDFPVLDLDTACAKAGASITGGLPAATADGQVASVVVNANEVAPVTDAVEAPVGQLIDGLKPVFDALAPADIDANTLIKDIVGAITDGGDVVRVSLGPAHAESGTTAGDVSALASAQGAVIEVLPRDELHLAPVITVEVGAASNSIVVNRLTGEATVNFDPAIVRVTLADDIAATLPDAVPNPIEVAPGVTQCFLPAPLESCITVAGGTQGTRPDEHDTPFAEASGVSLHLLTGVEDGVRLDLAATSVEAFALTDIPREDVGDGSPPLARTGGSTPLALMAVLIAVAYLGTTLSRASRRSTLDA